MQGLTFNYYGFCPFKRTKTQKIHIFQILYIVILINGIEIERETSLFLLFILEMMLKLKVGRDTFKEKLYTSFAPLFDAENIEIP